MQSPSAGVRVRHRASRPSVSAAPGGHRHDLDGLRAIAVLLVAVYHIWVHRVSGGVDVFLVLSGFFVGGSLLRRVSAGQPPAMGSYLLRIGRRLLPPLLLVVGVALAASVLLLPSSRWGEVARQGLASIFYVENWYLVSAGRDYGAADILSSPFQHIWSLSVQGQLFVALPLLLLAVAAVAHRIAPDDVARIVLLTASVAAVASFVYAVVSVRTDQGAAYYDTLARAWEYLAGALAGAALSRSAAGEVSTRGRTMIAVAGWVGFGAILATGFAVDGLQQFPGPAALVPVGGALLLILCWRSPWAPARLLAWRPLSEAGRYAYAFYLWHWPVLVFAIEVRGRAEVGWLAGSAVLLASAALAVVTRIWVEDRKPERELGRARARRSAVTLGVAVAVVAALPLAWIVRLEVQRVTYADAAIDLDRHPGALAVAYPDVFSWDPHAGIIPQLDIADQDKPRAVADGCGNMSTEVEVCSYGDLEADRVIVMAGGSHTEQWIDAIAVEGEQSGFRVDVMIKWTCELIDGLDGVEFFTELNPECEPWSANALTELVRMQPDAVFTTWTRPSDLPEGPREAVPAAYQRAWETLSAAGITTLAIRDNPWTGTDTVGCVAENREDPSPCGVVAADFLDVEPPAPVAAPGGAPVLPVDMTDIICPDGWCPFAQGGRLVYRDQHHLSNSYALSTSPILAGRILPLLGW